MSEKILRCVRSVDCDPADVFRSDAVSVPSETTLSTMELFAVPVGFGDVAAVWAGSACVFRFNIDYWNSRNFSLILDKALQLKKSPRMDYSSLATTINRYSQSYAVEVFKGYSSESVLSLLNNPFADDMVDCGSEPMFFSASFFEQTLSRFCSFSLEFASDFCVSASYSVKFFSNPSLAIAVCGDVSYAYVYAEKVFGYERFSFGHFNSCSKIEHAISEEQVCLSTDFVDSRLLIHTDLHGYSLSTMQSENAYGFKSFPTENTLVVNHSTVQVESSFRCFTGFVGVCYFADCSNSHLSGEVKSFSYVTVNEVVELPVVESFTVESCFGDAVAGFVESFHSFFKHVKLLRRRVELDCKRLLHTYMEKATPYLTFTLLRFLPPLKDVGILGGFR